jgi:hypothetical protein
MQQAPGFRIDLNQVIRLSEAVENVRDRMRRIDEQAKSPAKDITVIRTDPQTVSTGDPNSDIDPLDDVGVGYRNAKDMLVEAFYHGALELHARLRQRPGQGGPVDWPVPTMSVKQLRRGLKIIPLGNEANPLVHDLFNSDAYLDRKRFGEWLNAKLPMKRSGEWTAALDSEAVNSLGKFLKSAPNTSKKECKDHLLLTYPAMPNRAFTDRIWAAGRRAAGLPAKGRAGKKPGSTKRAVGH